MPVKHQRPRARLVLELLERRDQPAISGTVMQTLNVAGLFPEPSATLFGPVEGATVRLDDLDPQETGTDGKYTFASVSNGPHTVSVELPPGFIGLNAESLSYTLTYTGTDFTNLNFAATPRTEGLVQNLYELVLNRPADFDGFTTRVDALDGGASVGSVFNALYNSAEFDEIVQPVAHFLQAFFPGPLAIGPLRHSVELQNLGISQDATILDILYSQQFVDEHEDTADLSESDYVRFLFENLIGRQPNGKELNKYVAELQNGTNRGELALEIVDLKTRRPIQRRIGVSLVFLGVLGREATPAELHQYRGTAPLARIANKLANSDEFENLPGFTDTFFWDVLAHQSHPAVDPLSRLQIYNPETQAFDIAVGPNSINSTVAEAKNVYFVAHGWAPGSLEPVLLGSTPGNPLKSWETANSNLPDPPWLYAPTNQVSAEGLAQAIIDADPKAIVIAYSWIDLSATALAEETITVNLQASTTEDNATITVDASRLAVGMTVTGDGIPADTTVSSIASQTSVVLSKKATLTQPTVELTFSGVNVANAIEQFLYAGQSKARTQWSGLLLARAIEEALAPGFFPGQGLIHMLGHSHGSKVATVATLALQAPSVNIPVSHLTLLESPEGGPSFEVGGLHAPGLGGAQNFLWYYLQDMNISRTPITGTRAPTGGTFVDNYFSQEGFGSPLRTYASTFPELADIVDVLMHPEDLYGSLSITNVQQDATVVFGSHDYPPAWYGQASLQNPNGPANTLNGLYWSPLINPATTETLAPFYEQQQQSTPGEFVKTQFEVNSVAPPGSTTPEFTPLQYATKSTVGQVTDDGSSITLSVDASNTRAIDTITFHPLGTTGPNGTGMDFEFDFEGVDPGEQVELVIWINGMASVPQALPTEPLGNTIGFISIPLFEMDGVDAGDAAQKATISLDGFRVGLVLGPFNSVVNITDNITAPFVATIGFSLITTNGSTASVTVSEMRQFSDGIS